MFRCCYKNQARVSESEKISCGLCPKQTTIMILECKHTVCVICYSKHKYCIQCKNKNRTGLLC